MVLESYVAQAGLELCNLCLLILLSVPPMCWDYKYVLPHKIYNLHSLLHTCADPDPYTNYILCETYCVA